MMLFVHKWKIKLFLEILGQNNEGKKIKDNSKESMLDKS